MTLGEAFGLACAAYLVVRFLGHRWWVSRKKFVSVVKSFDEASR